MIWINVCLERARRGVCGMKPVLGICLVEATRLKFRDSRAGSCWWAVVAES